jgi:hypothetical protein
MQLALDGHKYYLQKEVAEDGDWGFIKLNRKNMDDVFLVDGYLNPTYHRIMSGGNTKICHHDGWDDPKCDQDSAWRHAIAIKNGRMICRGLSESQAGVTMKNLWLDSRGKPGPNGYMKELYVCTVSVKPKRVLYLRASDPRFRAKFYVRFMYLIRFSSFPYRRSYNSP